MDKTLRPFIKDYSPRQLVEAMCSLGHSSYRGNQLSRWLYARDVESFDEMSNLSRSVRQELSAKYRLWSIVGWSGQRSRDGSVKYTFQLHDGAEIEGVAIAEGDRYTYCLSTQVGCALGCYQRWANVAKCEGGVHLLRHGIS